MLCCDEKADKETVEWALGCGVFLNQDGEDLLSFSGAAMYWEDTGQDVFIFHQVLSLLARIDRGSGNRSISGSASSRSSASIGTNDSSQQW